MAQHDLMATAVEAHGVICGLVCGGVALDDKSWLPHFNDLINDGFGLPAPVRQVMTDSITGDREPDGTKGVELLLPSDRRRSMSASTRSLVDWSQAPSWPALAWCNRELSKASEELQEMIQDIASITQVSCRGSIRKMEENKTSFLVLYEHVRLRVMMAFEEFGKRPAAPSTPPTLH